MFIPQLDEVSNTVTARIYRIKQNSPELIGLAETKMKLYGFKTMKCRQKAGFLQLMAMRFLQKRGEVLKNHVDGVHYLLRGV